MIVLETEIERLITSDSEWVTGVSWGKPRPGHPEGAVLAHIEEVLANIDLVALSPENRSRLRLVALVHDSFKYQVDRSRDRVGANHHGALARAFAETYIDDVEVLEVIELHDEAFLSWNKGRRTEKWDVAEARARRLIERLGDSIDFYLQFFRADNATGDKEPDSVEWFDQLRAVRLPQ